MFEGVYVLKIGVADSIKLVARIAVDVESKICKMNEGGGEKAKGSWPFYLFVFVLLFCYINKRTRLYDIVTDTVELIMRQHTGIQGVQSEIRMYFSTLESGE